MRRDESEDITDIGPPRADFVVPENPDVPVIPSICLQGAQEGGDNVTPSHRATVLRRTESGMKGEKTKNSSNKNKERTSIAGAIVKLIEKQESGEKNAGVSAHMSANMTMMMMRQMEAMNNSMDRRDKRERRRERKERSGVRDIAQKSRLRKGQRCQRRQNLITTAERPGNNTAAAVIVIAPLTTEILTPVVVFLTRIVVMALDHGGGMVERMKGVLVICHNQSSKKYLISKCRG